MARNAIKSSVIVKKVIIDNKTIGMARVIGDGIYYLIVDVIINPEYQRKGIGKTLIKEIIKEITNITQQGQKCSIILEAANGKEEFYEKCGFRKRSMFIRRMDRF